MSPPAHKITRSRVTILNIKPLQLAGHELDSQFNAWPGVNRATPLLRSLVAQFLI